MGPSRSAPGAGARARRAAGLGAGALVLAALLAGCGSGPSRALVLSARSGYPGQAVNLSGNAGPGCAPGRAWPGFSFGPAAPTGTGSPGGLAPGRGPSGPSSPEVQMATPVAANGSWSATFVVPSYLPSRGKGTVVVPGRYQLWARWCNGQGRSTAELQVTSPGSEPAASLRYVGIAATSDGAGYWLVQADGQVSAFGDAPWFGSLPAAEARRAGPIAGIARTYDNQGYWLASASGQVFSFGDARYYGSLAGRRVTEAQGPVTAIAVTPDGRGYWLLCASGRVYGFGDARAEGLPPAPLGPYTGITTRPAGGYLVMGADNAAVVAYPGGNLVGGGPGTALPASLVGAATTPSGNGAWLAAADGTVVPVGDATSYIPPCTTQCPSVPANHQVVTAPVTGIASTPSGQGYWLVGADGNVYNFGNAPYLGSGYR